MLKVRIRSGSKNVQSGAYGTVAGGGLRNRSPHTGSLIAVLVPQRRRRRDGAEGSQIASLLRGFHQAIFKYFKHMNSVASNIRLHQQAQPTEDNRLERLSSRFGI